MTATHYSNKIYEAANILKEGFSYLHENDEEFNDYLLNRDYPEIVGYVELLINRGMFNDSQKEMAIEFLIIAIGDSNDNLQSRIYLYENGNEYFAKWDYFIPSTKDVMKEISYLFD